MNYIIYFVFGFIVVYLFYLITVILQKKRYEKFRNSNQTLFFVNRFKIKSETINMKKFLNEISLINSFVIAISFTIACIFENLILQLVIGFIAVVIFILLMYTLYGKILKKRCN